MGAATKGEAMSKKLSSEPADSARRVFIDVSRLIDPRLVHTGIARYGRELLRHLPLVSNDEVWAVVQEPPLRWKESNNAAAAELLELVEGRLISVEAQGSFTDALCSVGPLSARDVFHSIHLPLPSPQSTGSAARLLTVHDVLHLRRPDLYVGGGTPPIQRSIDSLTHDDIVLCDSEQTRTDLLIVTEHPGSRAITVPLGCAPPLQIQAVTSRHDITCLVQLAPRKNSAAVLSALAHTLANRQQAGGPPSAAHIFTPNTRADMVHNAMGTANVNPALINVEVDAKDEVINTALARSRAFLWGSEYEGFGLPVLEAMAHGAVPVLSPNSSHVEVAGDSGAYAPDTDPASLAGALNRVLSDSAYAERLSNRAIQRARHLSWRNTASNTVRSYTQARRDAAARTQEAPAQCIE